MSAALPPLRTPSSLRWCRDGARVALVDEARGLSLELSGFDAAAWAWLSLGYRRGDLVQFAQAFLRLPEPEAQASLDRLLEGWVERGILSTEAAA